MALYNRTYAFNFTKRRFFSVLYCAKVHIIKWSIQDSFFCQSEYDYLAVLSTLVLTLQSTKWMKDHLKSLDRPSLKLDCPSGLSFVLASFSPMGLCLWGSSLPGEPSCQETERDHQLTKHKSWIRKYIFYFDISICDTSYMWCLLYYPYRRGAGERWG